MERFHADSTLDRYKAHLVTNGNSQQLGVDFDETFSPVVKPATIRMVLILAVSRKCPIHRLDIKNAFLNSYNDVDLAGCPSTRSVEAEYRGVANVVAETAWLRNPLHELHSPLSTTTFVYYDNVRVLHVPSHYQFVDVFTKGLPSALFEEFRSSLSVHLPLAPT
ncbi:ribonuclease H-like domain-containing protein, partial [Tanacetum coccineum]